MSWFDISQISYFLFSSFVYGQIGIFCIDFHWNIFPPSLKVADKFYAPCFLISVLFTLFLVVTKVPLPPKLKIPDGESKMVVYNSDHYLHSVLLSFCVALSSYTEGWKNEGMLCVHRIQVAISMVLMKLREGHQLEQMEQFSRVLVKKVNTSYPEKASKLNGVVLRRNPEKKPRQTPLSSLLYHPTGAGGGNDQWVKFSLGWFRHNESSLLVSFLHGKRKNFNTYFTGKDGK